MSRGAGSRETDAGFESVSAREDIGVELTGLVEALVVPRRCHCFGTPFCHAPWTPASATRQATAAELVTPITL